MGCSGTVIDETHKGLILQGDNSCIANSAGYALIRNLEGVAVWSMEQSASYEQLTHRARVCPYLGQSLSLFSSFELAESDHRYHPGRRLQALLL